MPVPLPQGIALGPAQRYVSFRGVPTIFATDGEMTALRPLCEVADTAWGLTAHADRVWAVVGLPPSDERHVFSFDDTGRPAEPPLRCPDATGSYLAHDGATLYLSQWYDRRIYRLRADDTFEPVASTQRGICGIVCVGKALAVLNTEDEETEDYFLTLIDVAQPDRPHRDVARVPLRVRSLAWTGTTFLTNHRERGELLEFSVPSLDTQAFLRLEG